MRRSFIIVVAILVIAIALIVTYDRKNKEQRITQYDEISTQAQPYTWRAVSLRVLNDVAKGISAGEYSDDVSRLCGVTKLHGFVVDLGEASKEGDIILLGEVDPDLPSLYLDDFVVALRNAWRKYARLEGNTYYYSVPGCSIDPDSKTLIELQQIARTIFGSSSEGKSEEVIQKWKRVGAKPQKVRVMGVPSDSHFAKVMVDADYYAKRLVDGSESLNIKGFVSLVDMNLNKAKEDIINHRPISIPTQCLNRFWFFPGENDYVEDQGVVLINRCEVTLLTEQEFITHSGDIAGSGMADPFAQKFAENFTERYEQIAYEKPIYAELESLFRFVSLAQAMKFRDAISQTGIDLDFLMTQYAISETQVPQTLPGIANVKEFSHKANIPGGMSIAYLCLPSCGGVSIDIKASNGDFVKREAFDPTSSAHFRVRDFKDPTSLVSKLQDAEDPVSQYLQGRFSVRTREMIRRYVSTTTPSEELQKALADELNSVIHDESFYDQRRFSHIEERISAETKKLIRQKPKGRDLIRLNRLLLQEAYPEIRKSFINVSNLRDNCLRARPSHQSLRWDFPTPGRVRRLMSPIDTILG